MAPRSTQAAELNVEDFRRLGVRPHEYRLTVIRRAAIRSTRALAEQQLSAPTPQAGVQLSRVATSTYRLLDPRMRQETIHRAYIGRILPQSLSWDGETSFYSELSDFGATAGETGKVPFERSSLTDAELIEMLDLDSPPKSNQQSKPDLAVRLSDADLLRTTPLSRRVARWNARSKFRWLALAGAGLLFGASVSFAVHRWINADQSHANVGSSGSTASKVHVDTPSSPPSVRRLSSANSDHQKSTVAGVVSPQRHLVPDELREQLATAGQAAASFSAAQSASGSDAKNQSENLSNNSRLAPSANPNINPRLAPSANPNKNPRLAPSANPNKNPRLAPSAQDLRIGSQQRSASNLAQINSDDKDLSPHDEQVARSNPGSMQPAASTQVEMSEEAEAPTASLASDAESILPDPFTPGANEDSPPESIAPTGITPKTGEMASLPGVSPAGFQSFPHQVLTRIAVPNEASLRAARRELTELMPELALSIEADTARFRIARLELIERQFEIGSTEHWVVHTLIAEAAWLIESVAQVEQRLSSLANVYNVSPHRLLAESFAGASTHASLPATRQHLMVQGLRLADQLLLASAPLDCKHVVSALGTLVVSLPNQDARVLQYLKDYAESADLLTRYADVVAREQSQSEKLESSELSVLGRHYCLMLRRWDKGLKWLPASFDRQIAGIARRELQLDDNATADELKQIALLWLTAAARFDGRPADSMRLHAIDLLQRAQPNASGLTKLEIERQIDDATAFVPAHLLPVSALESPLSPGAQSGRRSPPVGLPLF